MARLCETVKAIVILMLTAAIVLFFFAAVISIVENRINEIDNGTVTDKFVKGYRATKYYLVIEGDKDGKTVQHYFAVSPNEYDRYKIGDFYSR